MTPPNSAGSSYPNDAVLDVPAVPPGPEHPRLGYPIGRDVSALAPIWR